MPTSVIRAEQMDALLFNEPEAATDPRTDLANAQRLVADCGESFKFIEGNGPHRWDGRHWKKDSMEGKRNAQRIGRLIAQESANLLVQANAEDDEQARKKLMEDSQRLTQWAKTSENRQKIESALALAEPHLTIPTSLVNADPMKLCVQNGTLDLRTFVLLPHQREDYITKYIDIPYDPNATCPLWKDTLRGTLVDQRNIDYFQRFCGYGATGDTSEHAMLIAYGAGKNGKSTIFNTVRSVLGPYSITGAPDLLMQTKNTRHAELADLFGARVVTVAETPQNGVLNENLVKQTTGGDAIKGRKLYKDYFEFKPTHKLWVMTNHLPEVGGTDTGIWRRIHLLPFNHAIPEDQRDKHREEKLRAELPGILNWVIEGCMEWQNQGLNPPRGVREAGEAYKSEQDVFQEFIEECCEFSGQSTFANLFKTYKDWCLRNGEHSESRKWVSGRLKEKGLTGKHTSTGAIYRGIQVRDTGYQDDRYDR